MMCLNLCIQIKWMYPCVLWSAIFKAFLIEKKHTSNNMLGAVNERVIYILEVVFVLLIKY